MAVATLTIDLDAIASNWRALDAMSATGTETAAVVKADAYGLGISGVAPKLAATGARTFFVALASEGAALRAILGPSVEIFVFSGYMAGDQDVVRSASLVPLLNSPDQIGRFLTEQSGHPCGLQLDSGMNRLGIEPVDLPALMFNVTRLAPRLVSSHLACADTPDTLHNAAQLAAFVAMSAPLPVKKSLAATGGILMGPSYHFNMTRPGVGLYGGLPFDAAQPVVRLDLPVIQIRDVLPGEFVGYGATWTAPAVRKIATVAAGYADGISRATQNAVLYAGATPCPVVGRISMDLVTVDVTDAAEPPDSLQLLGPHQSVDDLATASGTIGYEVLTSLGARYNRTYIGA